jgi:hypothetical protein
MSVLIIVSLSHLIFLSIIHFATSSGVATPSVCSCFFNIVTLAGFIRPCSWSFAGSLLVKYSLPFESPAHTTGSAPQNAAHRATFSLVTFPLLTTSKAAPCNAHSVAPAITLEPRPAVPPIQGNSVLVRAI